LFDEELWESNDILFHFAESITIPWVTTPDTVAVNPFVNNPSAFAQWMATNGLTPNSVGGGPAVERQQQEQLQQAQHFLQQAMNAAQQLQRGTSQGSCTIHSSFWSKVSLSLEFRMKCYSWEEFVSMSWD
jgi:hypothetical protein